MGPQVTAGLSTVCVPSEGSLGREGHGGWTGNSVGANEEGVASGVTYRAVSALLSTRYIS